MKNLHGLSGKLALLFFTLTLIGSLTACGTFRRMNLPDASDRQSVDASATTIRQVRPKSYAVYPFMNTAFEDDAGLRARRAVSAAFSLLGATKTIAEVDRVANGVRTPEDAIRTGRALGVDAVVLGEVTSEDHFWALMVSGSWAEMKVNVYSTSTGKLLWHGTTAARNWDVNPLIFSSVIDNVYRKRIIDNLYYEMAADIVKNINPSVYSNTLPKVTVN